MDGRTRVGALLLARGADDWTEDRNGLPCRAIARQRRMWLMLAVLQVRTRVVSICLCFHVFVLFF